MGSSLFLILPENCKQKADTPRIQNLFLTVKYKECEWRKRIETGVPEQPFSKCGPRTTSFIITWKLVRMKRTGASNLWYSQTSLVNPMYVQNRTTELNACSLGEGSLSPSTAKGASGNTEVSWPPYERLASGLYVLYMRDPEGWDGLHTWCIHN